MSPSVQQQHGNILRPTLAGTKSQTALAHGPLPPQRFMPFTDIQLLRAADFQGDLLSAHYRWTMYQVTSLVLPLSLALLYVWHHLRHRIRTHSPWVTLNVVGFVSKSSVDLLEIPPRNPISIGLQRIPVDENNLQAVIFDFDDAIALTSEVRHDLMGAIMTQKLQPVIGLHDFLNWLQTRGIKALAIMDYPEQVAQEALQALRLDDKVKPLISGSGGSDVYPKALKMLDLPSSQVLYITANPQAAAVATSLGIASAVISPKPLSEPFANAPHYIGLLPYCPGALPAIASDQPTCWFAGRDVFSNFSSHPVHIGGLLWPTSEHYYQSRKFAGNAELQELIRQQPTPAAAAHIGRDPQYTVAADWEESKRSVMMTALLAKFTQNSECRQQLLASGNMLLVEYSEKDKYWGRGRCTPGSNYLGRCLMVLRDYLIIQGPTFVWDGVTAVDITPLVDAVWQDPSSS